MDNIFIPGTFTDDNIEGSDVVIGGYYSVNMILVLKGNDQ